MNAAGDSTTCKLASFEHPAPRKHWTKTQILLIFLLILSVLALSRENMVSVAKDRAQNYKLDRLGKHVALLERVVFNGRWQREIDDDGKDKSNNNTNTNNNNNTNNSNNNTSRRLPQCIIIGARKSGTRALLDALNMHPMIKTARYEVHFFDSNQTFKKGNDWYRNQMPESTEEQITVEKTPGYFTSELAPKRIFEMNNSMKLLLIVRNPVTRAVSDYTQVHYTKLARNKSHQPFEELAFVQGRKNNNNSAAATLNMHYKPVVNSLYAIHLQKWLKYFKLKENILILDGDRFVSDPMSQIRQVERFLGIPQLVKPDQMYFNKTKGFYCFKPAGSHKQAHCLGDSKGRPHVTISELTKEKLNSALLPYNELFFKLINRTFEW